MGVDRRRWLVRGASPVSTSRSPKLNLGVSGASLTSLGSGRKFVCRIEFGVSQRTWMNVWATMLPPTHPSVW